MLQCLAPVRAVVGESPRITVVWRHTWIDLLRLRGVSAVLEAVVGTIGRLVGYDRRFGLSSISFNQRSNGRATANAAFAPPTVPRNERRLESAGISR